MLDCTVLMYNEIKMKNLIIISASLEDTRNSGFRKLRLRKRLKKIAHVVANFEISTGTTNA